MMPSSAMRSARRTFALVLPLLCAALSASCAERPPSEPPPAPLLVAEMGPPIFLQFSPDQRELAVLAMFGHGLFDTTSWRKARSFDVGIRMLAYSEDGAQIATAEGTDGARLWSARDLKPSHVLLTPAESAKPRRVFATAFSADGEHVLSADASGHVKVWDTRQGKLEANIAAGDASVRAAAFDRSGKRLAFGDEAGVLHIWDLEHGSLERDVPTPLGAITSVSYAHDGARLVTTHVGPTGDGAMIWDTRSWKAQVEAGYRAAAFTFDGKTLALGGADVRLLDPENGQAMKTIALDGSSQAQALAWRRDGRVLAVGTVDGRVRFEAMP